MTNPYGPWATAIDSGRNLQLSAFWKQRLTMLVPTSRTSPVLSQRSLLGLLALAAAIGVLPTFHAVPAVAEQEKVAHDKSKDQPPAAKTDAVAKTVRGQVIDASGKPVAGAELWLSIFNPKRHALHVKSDSQGRFALEVPSAGVAEMQPWERALTLWAFAPGHELGTTQVYLPDNRASEAAIRLGPAAETSFVVLDPNRRPCIGAFVDPYYVKTSIAYQSPPEELLPRVGARTDAEGRVKLSAASRDLLSQIRITTKDFGTQVQRIEKSEPSAIVGETIRLRPVGKIVGRIVTDQPELLRGLRLVLTTGENRLRAPPLQIDGFADIEPDAQGRFVVPAMAVGNLLIEARVDENLPLRPKLPNSMQVEADKTTEIQIHMVPTVVVRGSIRTKDTGQPISGALIHIYYGVGRQGAQAVSDTLGKYTALVLPGRVGLQVIYMPNKYEYVQMGEPWLRPYDVPKDAKDFDLPPLEVVPTRSIAGRVIDQRDQPVANLWISVLEGNRRYGTAKSDGNGKFNLPRVPATINPAKAKYQLTPETGVTGPIGCEVLTSDPLLLRARPPKPQREP